MVFEANTAGPYHEAFAWAIWIDKSKLYKQRPTTKLRILKLMSQK